MAEWEKEQKKSSTLQVKKGGGGRPRAVTAEGHIEKKNHQKEVTTPCKKNLYRPDARLQ